MRGGHPMRSDIVPGGGLPDYSLPDHTGTVRTLSELQGRDPMILMLARPLLPKRAPAAPGAGRPLPEDRGGLHPDRHYRHRGASHAAGVPRVGGRSVDLPVRPGRIIQQDLDIAEYTDPENNPMIPHTLVLKPGLTIHSIDNGYWLWGRPSFYDLREATKEIRPDWDLNTPGLRETWNAGDYSPFHGWQMRSGEPPAAIRPG